MNWIVRFIQRAGRSATRGGFELSGGGVFSPGCEWSWMRNVSFTGLTTAMQRRLPGAEIARAFGPAAASVRIVAAAAGLAASAFDLDAASAGPVAAAFHPPAAAAGAAAASFQPVAASFEVADLAAAEPVRKFVWRVEPEERKRCEPRKRRKTKI